VTTLFSGLFFSSARRQDFPFSGTLFDLLPPTPNGLFSAYGRSPPGHFTVSGECVFPLGLIPDLRFWTKTPLPDPLVAWRFFSSSWTGLRVSFSSKTISFIWPDQGFLSGRAPARPSVGFQLPSSVRSRCGIPPFGFSREVLLKPCSLARGFFSGPTIASLFPLTRLTSLRRLSPVSLGGRSAP